MRKQEMVEYKPLVDLRGQETGLECPLCGCRTLNRDTAPVADGWYVEWCVGGVLRLVVDGEEYEFECPYAWAGFKGRVLVEKRDN